MAPVFQVGAPTLHTKPDPHTVPGATLCLTFAHCKTYAALQFMETTQFVTIVAVIKIIYLSNIESHIAYTINVYSATLKLNFDQILIVQSQLLG